MKNGVMLQSFEWNTYGEGRFYKELAKKAKELKEAGITGVWLPPASKGTSDMDVGYGVYDLYDLGEFDQKGSVRTKYGTKKELIAAIKALKKEGLEVYADLVLNHKANADETELVQAVKVDPQDRNKEISEPMEIEAWTKFTFPGRGKKYSDFQWNWTHFTGVDSNARTGEHGIFKLIGADKNWSQNVSTELGNFDYLMFADVDVAHPDVREEYFKYAEWLVNELGLDGFRLDAVKHIDSEFMNDFISHIKAKAGDEFYAVGEYWLYDEAATNHYLYKTDYDMDLFDVGLHFNFQNAAKAGEDYDLRKIFDNSIVQEHPQLAVTFVDNHDSQPGQALESWVDAWFKPLAYAMVLLRKDGYPCVFAGDYYGIEGDEQNQGHADYINRLIKIRQEFVFGEQKDLFQDEHCIGWVLYGDENHPGKMVVGVNNASDNALHVDMGSEMAGKTFVNKLNEEQDQVVLDEDGKADFPIPGGGVAVWVG